MNQLRVISPGDTAAIQEVLGEAYGLLGPNIAARSPEIIGISELCIQTTDAATRAAHGLGIVASREWHGSHALTSFAPLDQMPSEEDLVLDMTWGQFNLEMFEICGFNEFIGPRRELARYVGDEAYYRHYSANSTVQRQIVHTPSSKFSGEHLWLRTAPEQVASGTYRIGEVDQTTFAAMEERLGLTSQVAAGEPKA